MSAAICLFRRTNGELEVLVAHPGGPFWAKKDLGAWSLPKGEFDPAQESGIDAARREFEEEVGHAAPQQEPIVLGETRLKSGKTVMAWALEGDLDPSTATSNTFEIEWPPRSGQRREFPEVDRVEWCSLSVAAEKLNPAQVVFLDRLAQAHES